MNWIVISFHTLVLSLITSQSFCKNVNPVRNPVKTKIKKIKKKLPSKYKLIPIKKKRKSHHTKVDYVSNNDTSHTSSTYGSTMKFLSDEFEMVQVSFPHVNMRIHARNATNVSDSIHIFFFFNHFEILKA